MKLNHNDAQRFPKLLKYLKSGFPDVLKKVTIQKGLQDAGIDYKDAVIYMTYGYDPLVDVRTMPGNDCIGWERTSKWTGGANTYGIQLATEFAKYLGRDDLVTFSIAGTIRYIDAALLTALVLWRKLAEAGGSTKLINDEELFKIAKDFQEKALGSAQTIINPFL